VVGAEDEVAGGDVGDVVPAARGLVGEDGGGVALVFQLDVVDEEGDQHGAGSCRWSRKAPPARMRVMRARASGRVRNSGVAAGARRMPRAWSSSTIGTWASAILPSQNGSRSRPSATKANTWRSPRR